MALGFCAPHPPTSACPTPWQIAALRKMRIDEAEKLLEKGNLFSDDVKIVASVVHGGVGPELLRVADEHVGWSHRQDLVQRMD